MTQEKQADFVVGQRVNFGTGGSGKIVGFAGGNDGARVALVNIASDDVKVLERVPIQQIRAVEGEKPAEAPVNLNPVEAQAEAIADEPPLPEFDLPQPIGFTPDEPVGGEAPVLNASERMEARIQALELRVLELELERDAVMANMLPEKLPEVQAPQWEVMMIDHYVSIPSGKELFVQNLRAALNAGWEIINMTVLFEEADRETGAYATLRRQMPATPIQPEKVASAVDDAETVEMPVAAPEPVVIIPAVPSAQEVLAKLLEDKTSVTAQIRAKGLRAYQQDEAVKVANAAAQAVLEHRAAHPVMPRRTIQQLASGMTLS